MLTKSASYRQRIAVVYVGDRNFHQLAQYSIASVARAHRAPLDFYFMQSEYKLPISSVFHSMIETLGHRLIVLEAPFFEPARRFGNNGHITRTTFLRVAAIDVVAADYAYVLYLDGDILAFADIQCERVAGFPEAAAACLDLSCATGFDDPSIFENCRRSKLPSQFFNAGVLMVNSKKWRGMRVLDRFAENLVRHGDGCPYFRSCAPNDQCPLNMILGADLRRLPVSWNVQKSALHTGAWARAAVRHYTGAAKFLPVRSWRCDLREYLLLQAIGREFGLPKASIFFDGGISYSLNKIRRYRTVQKYERAIAQIEHGRPL